MATSVAAPAQHKQPSRKGKKAWRKNVDTTEIEKGLKEVQEEVITGGIISEKPSSELFALDTTGSAQIAKTYKTGKPLKADEILAARSAVPAVSMRKRPASRTTDGILPPKSKKPRISGKEYDRLRAIAYGGEQVQKNIVRLEGATHDPWAAEEMVRDPASFLEEKRAKREPNTLKRAPTSLAASGKALPAVRRPEAGKSYNPMFDDWKEVLTREGNKEVEAEKKRLAKAEVERVRQERIMAIAAEPEVGSDDGESAWESEWEGFQSELEEDFVKNKRPERKTQAERNKINRRKEAERKALHEAKIKEKDRQGAQIKALAKAVKQQEKAREDAQALALMGQDDSSSNGDDEVLRRKPLGKARIPESMLEVVLPDELEDSLRRLKPEGNLLKDRFRSMIVRGRIESRRPIAFHKQAKTKATEKWSYKDWKLPQ